MELKSMNLAAEAGALGELWSPRVVARVNDSYVKVAKVHGTFVWHAHEDEDEMFLVLKGRLRIELEEGAVELSAGDAFVVPKGIRHNPVADEECWIALFEPVATTHTGGETTERTKSIQDQLRGA